jgi:ubiquinone/menaquinone biosynthesis C-methylase UbiE
MTTDIPSRTIINKEKLSMDSKQAEKEYLRRSAGGAWEMSKPFPVQGQTGSDEHAQHLLDFAVLLRILVPRSSDLILDLGAGSCWVSEWLRRFGARTVAVDIALDMLRLGRARLKSADGLVAGDMESLPFAANTFNKACCLNAFHHVPDIHSALSEIRRVLTPDGVALFSEPGLGHATNPTSVAATRNYGVQENEIRIEEFMDACMRAGFADVRLHPITHIVPLFELTSAQWADWATFTSSQRPSRALEKLYRAVLELFGLRKNDLLFEEAFAIRLLRELQPVIEQHPVITAYGAPFVKPLSVPVDAAEIELVQFPAAITVGNPLRVVARITNCGTTTWNAIGAEEVRLGAQLLAADGVVIDRNYARRSLPTLMPGGRCELVWSIHGPNEPGPYSMRFDVVREGINWFETVGSRPSTAAISVTR